MSLSASKPSVDQDSSSEAADAQAPPRDHDHKVHQQTPLSRVVTRWEHHIRCFRQEPQVVQNCGATPEVSQSKRVVQMHKGGKPAEDHEKEGPGSRHSLQNWQHRFASALKSFEAVENTKPPEEASASKNQPEHQF